MFPLPFAGLAVAGRMLLSKYNALSLPNKRQVRSRTRPTKKPRSQGKYVAVQNPLPSLFKNLRLTLMRGLSNPAGTDYNSIVKSFIPADAKILKPRFPAGSRKYQIIDLDGDAHKELIASYKQKGEVTTIILRQQSGNWDKIAEVSQPGYETLHYRSIASLSDEGGKQLLIGLAGNGKTPCLFGYSMENNDLQLLFNKTCHRLELLSRQRGRNGSNARQLAIWERNSTNAYNIDVFQLKNGQLEAVSDIYPYYLENVIPYYARRIKQSPYAASNWYNLAEALIKIKAYQDAQAAIDIGSRLDTDSALREKFEALKGKAEQMDHNTEA